MTKGMAPRSVAWQAAARHLLKHPGPLGVQAPLIAKDPFDHLLHLGLPGPLALLGRVS
jgi:hypothetical protein